MSCRCPGTSYILYAAVAAAFIVLMAGHDTDSDADPPAVQVSAQHQHDHEQAEHPHQRGDAPPQQQPADQGNRGFPDLVTGLKNTEGCLGVETAKSSSGKNVIFAWFEDKNAAKNWYNSEMHQRAMNMFFPDRDGDREPMAGVPDDIPIMAIASITFTDQPQHNQTTLPVSQIAIELYTPVTGGLNLGGRFAPDELEVPDMKDYGNPPQ